MTLKGNAREDSGGWVDVDKALDITRLTWRGPDLAWGFWMNRASLTGRSFDALKFALGAFNVFLVGNYVMFQPWDRDNCKMWYVGLFVSAGSVGALMAAPFEALAYAVLPGLSSGVDCLGFHRLLALSGSSYAQALWLAQPFSAGDKGPSDALPTACYAVEDKVLLPALEAPIPGDAKSDSQKQLKRLQETLKASSSKAVKFASVRTTVSVVAFLGLVVAVVAFFFSTFSGFLMIRREFGLYHQLLDPDQFEVCCPFGLSPRCSALLLARVRSPLPPPLLNDPPGLTPPPPPPFTPLPTPFLPPPKLDGRVSQEGSAPQGRDCPP